MINRLEIEKESTIEQIKLKEHSITLQFENIINKLQENEDYLELKFDIVVLIELTKSAQKEKHILNMIDLLMKNIKAQCN